MSLDTLSPMMVQWHACKQQADGALLLFRLGDFYEAFEQDALILSQELDLTLTKRQEVPMAGIPHHTAEGYIDKLISKGHRVAIAEQMEDPRLVKGLVKREVVRIITPGTVIQSSLLSDKANNFLACVVQLNGSFGLAVLDLTTADFRALECEELGQLTDTLCRLRPKELLIDRKWVEKHGALAEEWERMLGCSLHLKPSWHFESAHCTELLLRHFKVHQLDAFGLQGMSGAIIAAGAVLNYVQHDLNLSVSHLTDIRAEHPHTYMLLDRSTQRHLELTQPLHPEGKTLLDLLDETQTPMGGRLLKQWLLHPLLDPGQINLRQEAIEKLQKIPLHLSEIRDLERLMMRIETGFASPRDLAGLRFSLEQIPQLILALQGTADSLITHLSDMRHLTQKIGSALVDTPPLRITDGNLFKPGYHAELDVLQGLKNDSATWMANYQQELREEAQIKSLKVGYTKAFGFYIEVSRGQSDKIPESFQRRQTLVNAERFITPELKEYEYKMLHAEEKIKGLELELFHALRKEVAAEAQKIRKIAQAVGEIDVLHCLASVAKKHKYVRPTVDRSDRFMIEQGRHPVIESVLRTEAFIPNDVEFTQAEQLMVITGPNMAGKSTFIRQVALITLLAQIGSFVPAKSAHIGIIDKLFSRIGASDDLSRGQSTFMVEMTETANILRQATAHSLVILDEIGRGTSTYDGISIAWAVAEHLLEKKAKTLFATHYWELTDLEKQAQGAVNYNVAVHESADRVVFLHKIVKGGTDKSYGIHVARLAGLPHSVILRAKQKLSSLEKKPIAHQPSLFS